jgi:hypothetical protein
MLRQSNYITNSLGLGGIWATARYGIDSVSHAEHEIAPQNTKIEEAITYYQGASSMYENMLKR